jgi:hypothetical protein
MGKAPPRGACHVIKQGRPRGHGAFGAFAQPYGVSAELRAEHRLDMREPRLHIRLAEPARQRDRICKRFLGIAVMPRRRSRISRRTSARMRVRLRFPEGELFRSIGQLPHISFASSRSLNFWILPVLVFGNSVNTMWRGTL